MSGLRKLTVFAAAATSALAPLAAEPAAGSEPPSDARYVDDHHYNLAATLARMGRTEDAVRHYEMALALRPNYAKAWLNLGNILARGGEYRRAIGAYQRALNVDPDLAAALRYLDDWPGAVRVWSRAASGAQSGIARELAMARLFAADRAGELGADEVTVLLVKALAWRGSGKGLRSEAAWNRAREAMALSRKGDRLRTALLERAEAIFE